MTTTINLPTIATFVTYAADGVTEVATGVSRVSASVEGSAGDWGIKIVITLVSERFGPEQFAGFVPGGIHFRYQDSGKTYRTRELAKGAARTIIADHLGDDFTGAVLRINGRDRGTL
jgi:hypothetical protein